MKIKGLMRLSIVLLCVILTLGMTLCTTISVFAELSVWNDSLSKTVCTWTDTQIKYGHKKLNNNSKFYFYASGLHAIKQWEDALDISIENVVSMSEANIKVYGGTWDELTVLGVDLTRYMSTYGFAFKSKAVTFIREDTIDGERRTINQLYEVTILIFDKGLMSDYNRVTTHELGHGLGWQGHSSDKSDVMYAYSNGVAELTQRDKEHLLQVY